MTGFNLPPGCNVRDIPGNTPEDERREALYDSIGKILDEFLPQRFSENETLMEAIVNLIDKAYTDGYFDGAKDEAIASEWRKEE